MCILGIAPPSPSRLPCACVADTRWRLGLQYNSPVAFETSQRILFTGIWTFSPRFLKPTVAGKPCMASLSWRDGFLACYTCTVLTHRNPDTSPRFACRAKSGNCGRTPEPPPPGRVNEFSLHGPDLQGWPDPTIHA